LLSDAPRFDLQGPSADFELCLVHDSSWAAHGGQILISKSAQADRRWRVRGWGPKKRNPFSAHQSLTLREAVPPGQSGYGFRPSPPEPELGDNRPVTLDVGPLQIVQQSAPLPDQLEQPAPRIVVVGVRFQVVGEVIDPFAEDCDLDLG
jgi:hypothetical protein